MKTYKSYELAYIIQIISTQYMYNKKHNTKYYQQNTTKIFWHFLGAAQKIMTCELNRS